VGNIKGVGRIYQQTFIDSYSKVTLVKLYDRKHAITAADMLNDRVLPWFEQQGVALLRILTDRGSEFCGNREHHEYALYLDTAVPRPNHRKPTVFVSASTKRFRTSSMPVRFGASSLPPTRKRSIKRFANIRTLNKRFTKRFCIGDQSRKSVATFGHSKKRTLLGLPCAKSSIRDDRA